MFHKKESPNGRQERQESNYLHQNASGSNQNNLKTNLLSEDYGELAFADVNQNGNNTGGLSNRTSLSRREQNQHNIANQQIQSGYKPISKDQTVELEQKQPASDSEKRRSFLDQSDQQQPQLLERDHHASINNLNPIDQIIFSRTSQQPQNTNSNNNNENINNLNNQLGDYANNQIAQQALNQVNEDNFNDEDEQVQKISIIFLKALRQFLQGQKINFGYSIAKIVVGSVVLFLSIDCGFSHYALWVLLLIGQSFIAIIYNLRSINKMQEPLFAEEIALDLHQIEMFPLESQPDDYVDYILVEDQLEDQENMQNINNRELMQLHRIPFSNVSTQEEDFRKVSMMVLQLKYECKKRDKIAMIAGYSQFLLYLGLQIWAIVQFFITDNIFESFSVRNSADCNLNLLRYIFIVVLIGFFQYLDYYIIFTLFAICSIFILFGLVYYLIKICKKKRKRTKFIRKLKTVKYNSNLFREDQDCSICLNSFEESEKVIVLPCPAQHHFHDDCIKGWLKVNSTCPMCRTCFENYE